MNELCHVKRRLQSLQSQLAELIETVERLESAASASSPDQHIPPASATAPRLTAREREVLELLACGCSNQQIATRLYLSPCTVKFHCRNLYEKLGVRSRGQAAQAFARMAQNGSIPSVL